MTDNNSDIYVQILKPPSNDLRINKLKAFFIEQFSTEPKFIVKVPGRVNIIGEHIDYCGYPVLPMAVEQNIMLAVAPSAECKLKLININPKYSSFECNLDDFEITISKQSGPSWHNYFLCGVKGIFEQLPIDSIKIGMLIAVSGNVPPASGLSSSSALVSAAALATSYANNFSLEKQLLATISANCERFIGTEGGGMDQAIAFLAQKGCAQFIEWNPLKATRVTLPNNAVFVIANSLAEANKAANSDFNQRVIECRLGCSIIAKKHGLNWREINRFSSLQTSLDCTLEKLESLVNLHLPRDIYTVENVVNELEITVEDFEKNLLSANTKHLQEFKLKQRALHVFQETIRVYQFRELATTGGSIAELGKLMRQSHESLKVKYECSHAKLDRLVEISDKLGVGARLTGAGWGGCMVGLCESVEQSKAYINELKLQYYKQLQNIDGVDLDSVVFATSPQTGADIFEN